MDNDQLNYRLDEFFRILTQLVEQGKETSGRLGIIENDISEVKITVAGNGKKLDVLSGQFNDVAVMAIKDNQRIKKLEGEVGGLQSSIN